MENKHISTIVDLCVSINTKAYLHVKQTIGHNIYGHNLKYFDYVFDIIDALDAINDIAHKVNNNKIALLNEEILQQFNKSVHIIIEQSNNTLHAIC